MSRGEYLVCVGTRSQAEMIRAGEVDIGPALKSQMIQDSMDFVAETEAHHHCPPRVRVLSSIHHHLIWEIPPEDSVDVDRFFCDRRAFTMCFQTPIRGHILLQEEPEFLFPTRKERSVFEDEVSMNRELYLCESYDRGRNQYQIVWLCIGHGRYQLVRISNSR